MKNETDALNKAMIELQEKHVKELESLQERFLTTYDSIKPHNSGNGTIKDESTTSEIIGNIIGIAIGIGTGFLIKKLLVGRSHNPFRKLFGTMIHFAIANEVAKHNEGIKSTVENFMHRLLYQRNDLN